MFGWVEKVSMVILNAAYHIVRVCSCGGGVVSLYVHVQHIAGVSEWPQSAYDANASRAGHALAMTLDQL